MMVRVALRNVMRHRLRTAFTVTALATAVALLADMLMLSSGMEKTFYRVLSSVGYEVRVCPLGTLPFATDALIAESARVTRALDADERVERWLRVLGATLFADSTSLFAMGLDGRDQSLYTVVRGVDIDRPRDDGRTSILLDENAAAALGVDVGDNVSLSGGAPGILRAFATGGAEPGPPGPRPRGGKASGPGANALEGDYEQRYIVAGIIDVEFDLAQQRTLVLPLEALHRIRPETRDAASFVLAKLRAPTNDFFAPLDEQRAVAASLAGQFPELSTYSIDALMEALQGQLAYFKQFALILSTISVFITFLLIAVVLTIGVGERRGEIAALRSMGFRRSSVRGMVLGESAVLLALGAVLGSVLGWFLAGYLDRILTQSPSLPAGYRFFIPAPREIALAVLITGVAGAAAALLPAVFASRVDIPRTLHEEVV
ncbi:MAG: FtsX-like permease family protein [Candidatus Latescibacteria bacterium]|nr:FtsX-like permease family protein [Candidatus Latescibacterota bacterium]